VVLALNLLLKLAYPAKFSRLSITESCAGQKVASALSVGQTDIAAAQGWVDINNLQDPTNQAGLDTLVANVQKNIYVCEFIRHRIVTDPANPIVTFSNNIFQNNIIPVNPLSNKTDPSLSNYNCDLTRGQATPQNISTYPNFLNTGDAVNWLYFSANLRGGGKENLNVFIHQNDGAVSPTFYNSKNWYANNNMHVPLLSLFNVFMLSVALYKLF